MTIAVEQIAQQLTVSLAELQHLSLHAYFEREQRLTRLDIADLQDRYTVRTAAELAANIEQGNVHSHPAWEELIEWEQLEAYFNRLTKLQAELDEARV